MPLPRAAQIVAMQRISMASSSASPFGTKATRTRTTEKYARSSQGESVTVSLENQSRIYDVIRTSIDTDKTHMITVFSMLEPLSFLFRSCQKEKGKRTAALTRNHRQSDQDIVMLFA